MLMRKTQTTEDENFLQTINWHRKNDDVKHGWLLLMNFGKNVENI